MTNDLRLAVSPTVVRAFSFWKGEDAERPIVRSHAERGNEVIRYSSFVIILLGLAVLLGCAPSSSDTRAPAPQEPSWSDQLALARAKLQDRIELRERVVTDAQLAELSPDDPLRALILDHAEVTDAGLGKLAEVSALRHLKLREAPIGDAGLEHLSRLENLEVLNLPHGEFTDAGLAKLADLPHLRQLRFGGDRVTDAGMKSIRQMKSLRALHLIEVPITDAGLAEIAHMTWLESFYLDGGHVTDAGLQALLEALPKLHFHRDQHHLDYDHEHHRH